MDKHFPNLMYSVYCLLAEWHANWMTGGQNIRRQTIHSKYSDWKWAFVWFALDQQQQQQPETSRNYQNSKWECDEQWTRHIFAKKYRENPSPNQKCFGIISDWMMKKEFNIFLNFFIFVAENAFTPIAHSGIYYLYLLFTLCRHSFNV